MSDLTAEERDFLVDYCMKPENTWLALAIGQIQPELKKQIVSLFVKELDESVKGELEKRGLINWKGTITEKDLEKKEVQIYVMTLKDRGVGIQLVYYEEGYLGVGTPVSNGDWPPDLEGFLTREDLGLQINYNHWHWWFDPKKNHQSVRSIEALSKLNDNKSRREKIAYFTTILVCFAEAISKELGV